MPGEHLDALRRGHEAFNRGDIEGAREIFSEDVEWGTTGVWPGMGLFYRGLDGLEEWTNAIRGEWEEFEVSIEEVLREDRDAVAVVERLRGRGRGSGAEAEMSVYTVYWFDDEGKLCRRRAFTSADDALGALGASGS
jgi:ketosteroid isomerase-like protein